MTIDEAIKRLQRDYDPNLEPAIFTYNTAIRLGIEALTRLNGLSPYPHEYLGGPLPGETKEGDHEPS